MWSKFKKLSKKDKAELIFNIISLIFIITTIIFYLSRMFYFKNKLNASSQTSNNNILLINKIKENIVLSGDGLYQENMSYVYKGNNVNNYLIYNNIKFRIIRINTDQTIEIITEDPYNYLAYDAEITTFDKSNLNEYLNNYLINNFNINDLINSTICLDEINNLNDITCLNKNRKSYVKTLGIIDYLNSKNDNKTYLNANYNFWLYNTANQGIWNINNKNISISTPDNIYAVRPVLTLTNTIILNKGTGTLNDPYIINTTNDFGKYVKLNNDIYQIYKTEDETYRLILDSLYNEKEIQTQFSYNESSFNIKEEIGNYLNNTLVEKMSYKNNLLECDYSIGNYKTDYNEVINTKIKSKIGLLSIVDPIFNTKINNYYYLNKLNNNDIYVYKNNNLILDKSYLIKSIRPAICINKNIINKGTGTLSDPYVME